jgi:hypothetical protein
VYAVDNNTEFGIEDDLSILGNGGTAVDPDVEVKGFTVFGATQTAYTGISITTGSVVVNGQLAVSSGAYIRGGSTITDGAYFAGASTFGATVNFSSANVVYIGGGITNQVLKKASDGSMAWADDVTGASALSGTEGYVPFFNAGSISESQLWQNPGLNSMTLMLSSMTIQGTGSDGLGVNGDTKLTGNLSVIGAYATSLGGALTVTGVMNQNNAAYIGAAATKSTFSVTGALDIANNADITLWGTGKITLPNAPVAGTDGVNKDYVDNMTGGGGGPWTRVAPNTVKLSTITDSVGVGIAVPTAKLHVSSANAALTDSLFMVSSGTSVNQEIFGILANGEAGLKGNIAIGATYAGGSAPTNGMAVEGPVGIGIAAVEANNKLKVVGTDATGEFISKFYSGTKLAAWVKQK